MSEQPRVSSLNSRQALELTITQTAMLAQQNVAEAERIEHAVCQHFKVKNLDDLTDAQMLEAQQWVLLNWSQEMECKLRSVFDSLNRARIEVSSLVLQWNRHRQMVAQQFPRLLVMLVMLALALPPTLAAPRINIQSPAQSNEPVNLAEALRYTETMLLEDVQMWLAEYPAATSYADQITSAERTTFVDYAASFVVAELRDGGQIISARFNETTQIKLNKGGAVTDLLSPLPPAFSLSSLVQTNGYWDDNCDSCMNFCRGHARSLWVAEQDQAFAKFGTVIVGCAVIVVGTFPSLTPICLALATAQLAADINAAQRRYQQAQWQCGTTTCKRPNGIPCGR